MLLLLLLLLFLLLYIIIMKADIYIVPIVGLAINVKQFIIGKYIEP